MNSNIATSEILDLAADAIQMAGWTRLGGGWVRGGEEVHPLCVEGAIMAATGITSTHDAGACPAALAVIDYLGEEQCTIDSPFGGPRVRLWAWNDATGRTAEEVIEVLRAAAAVERLKESTALGLNVTLAYDTEDQPLPIKVAA